MKKYDVVVIGGGPAGLSAACAVKEAGIENLLLIDREEYLGGKLRDSIEIGYGEKIFGENLTGTEFVGRLSDRIISMEIPYKLNTTVINLKGDKTFTAVSPEEGVSGLSAEVIVFATGSRERPRGEVNLPVNKFAGIYTIGTAMRFVQVEGYLPGKKIVIVGSANAGMQASRRLTIEGAVVNAVIEPGESFVGSEENYLNCLKSFDIPIILNHSIAGIRGKDRVESIVLKRNHCSEAVEDADKSIECDTVLVTTALYPESELLRKAGVKVDDNGIPEVKDNYASSVEGIFCCGNILYFRDSGDELVSEGAEAGKRAAEYFYLKKAEL
jgi:thioredoxin reductase